jgi:hypothetical protein
MLCSYILLLCCVATTLVTTALVCLHDVSLMYACCGKYLWSGGRGARTTHVAHVMSLPHKPLHIPLFLELKSAPYRFVQYAKHISVQG